MTHVNTTIHAALLKPGIIGIQVRIMPSGITMPDEIKFAEEEKPEAVSPVNDVTAEKAVAGSEEAVSAEATTAAAAADGKSETKTEAGKAKAPKKRKAAAKPRAKKAESAAAAAESEVPADKAGAKEGKEPEVKDEVS